MKRVHFDSKGPVKWHYFFWQPWGCGGCLLRGFGFMVLLFIFLWLMSMFRSCATSDDSGASTGSDPVSVVPPINEEDIIEEDGRRLVGNRLNVLFGAETGQAEYEAWCERFHELYPGDEYQILFYDPNTKLMSIQVPEERREEIKTALPQQIPDIPFFVFEESVMDPGFSANDPVFRHPDHAYYFEMIKASQAWDITQGNPDVCVAIVDSYFDLENAEFSESIIVSPYSVATGDTIVALPDDYSPRQQTPENAAYMHGTMVAAMALGATNNGVASAGMAPRCRFMPISLSARFGCLSMLQGILYAINHRATVINISAGLAFTDAIGSLSIEEQVALARTELLDQEAVWQYVFEMAQRNYVTIVWAAGNENVFTAIDASKRGNTTIKVSAVDASGSKADFSNFGNFPELQVSESTLSAPGVQVPGLVPATTGYTLTDGTSFSSPIVAGCVGLVKSLDPTLPTDSIIQLLQSTGRAVSGNNTTIGPIVQIGPALQTLYSTFTDFDDLKTAITSGSSRTFACATMGYAEIEDSLALPPIVTIEIVPSGSNQGVIRYKSNRTPADVLEGSYTAQVDGQRVILSQQATQRLEGEGEWSYGALTLEISATNDGKAQAMVTDTPWWHRSTSFFVKAGN